MFAYCGNNPVNRIDISGADSDGIGEGEDLLDEAVLEGGGSGNGKPAGGSTGGGFGGTGNQSGVSFNWKGLLAELGCLLDMLGQTMSDAIGGLTGNIRVTPYYPVCFVEGTLVHAQTGMKPIEDICVGDLVWAWDEETGEVALREVVETYINEASKLVHIFANGEEIITTPAHPFYSPEKGWTDAVQLRAGDILVLVNGEYVVVEKVQHEILESPVTVYNFQVEGFHTYYVSNAGVLVHNVCANDIYNSVKESPDYIDGFIREKNGTTKVNIKNEQLLMELSKYGKGWKKVYSDGYLYGERVSMHYFQSKTGQVYNVKYKEGWSVLVGG